jgi:hypothetical protein
MRDATAVCTHPVQYRYSSMTEIGRTANVVASKSRLQPVTIMKTYQHTCTKFSMLKHVSKHPAVAAERFLGSLRLVRARWVLNELLPTDVHVTGHTGTDTIYLETLYK